jgi:hypothetical protein
MILWKNDCGRMTVGSKYHHVLKKAARLGFFLELWKLTNLPSIENRLLFPQGEINQSWNVTSTYRHG